MAFIKSLSVNENLKKYKFIGNDKSVISKVSKVNIFIGSNNSGKSRFLRNILLDNQLKINIDTEELEICNDFISTLNNEIFEVFQGTELETIGNIVNKKETLEEIQYLMENNNNQEKCMNLLEDLKNVSKKDNITSIGSTLYGQMKAEDVCLKLHSIYNRFNEKFFDNNLDVYLEKKKFKRIYIPTLRGLRRLNDDEDLFLKRTSNDYYISKQVEIFTGQDLYKNVLELLCGDFKERNKLRDFEEFLGDSFFDGKNLSLIPKINSDVLYVKIGEEKEQPIYNLGDGIQSAIILTFRLFSNKGKDVLFFIEEPELYLHPGLQRKVIETFLRDDFSTFQYFVTTHSNHLLDLTLDLDSISVYKFNKEIENNDDLEKDATFVIENVSNSDISLLNLLGVNNSSLFLSNCTIWVEGITDRLYIRKYFEIYQKEKFENREIEKIYSEDIHYSFLEYSGGNITHWDFLDKTQGEIAAMNHNRICNRIFLIADSDGYYTTVEGAKSERLKKLEEYFNDRFYCLKVKEIENMLIPNVIKSTVQKFKDGRITDTNKDQDGILFEKSTFKMDDYKEKNLGQFIDETIDKQIRLEEKNNSSYEYKRRRNYSKGNTINQKVDFCKNAISEIKSINDISEEAQNLCEKLYNFIKKNN